MVVVLVAVGVRQVGVVDIMDILVAVATPAAEEVVAVVVEEIKYIPTLEAKARAEVLCEKAPIDIGASEVKRTNSI
ncbi:MAG: hypothetical protein JWM14_3393 [Chitinophagaceae bacterium]|nr:hypothetical protein [Chitinophagaceae bacterium]